jgi:histidine triad (HIT) family protein
VFEDERMVAFLDINPLAEGHLLVVPKSHYRRLEEVPGEELSALARHLPRLSRAVVQATNAEGYNVLQNNGACAGQAVEHLHIHIIPRVAGDGLGYRWNATKYASGRDKVLHEKLLSLLK